MGICKCRKRTNLVCWHCQSPICFDCVTENEHKLGYVATYAEFLSSPSPVSPVCPLSKKILTESDEVIRFTNLQIFGLVAIDKYCQELPQNTEASRVMIPGTTIAMVPARNDRSLLAKQIRQNLSSLASFRKFVNAAEELKAQVEPENPEPQQGKPTSSATAPQQGKPTSSTAPPGLIPRKSAPPGYSGPPTSLFTSQQTNRLSTSQPDAEVIEMNIRDINMPDDSDNPTQKYQRRSIGRFTDLLSSVGQWTTTLQERWKHDKIRFLVVIVFLCTIVGVFFSLNMSGDSDTTRQEEK